MYRVSPFVRHFAWALLGGATLATLWVNVSPTTYYDMLEWRIADLSLPHWLAPRAVSLTPLLLVSDVAMALFLGFIAKELWEALALERGALVGRQAIMPFAMMLGSIAGSAVFWLGLSNALEQAEEMTPAMGWYVPCASDVVLCYVIGRRVFGARHPALHILLLITIATNIASLLIHGLYSPEASPRLAWLALPLAASLLVWRLFGRKPAPGATEQDRRRLTAIWPYIVAGVVSWIGVAASGLPPALGLLPIVPAIAHADRTFGIFAEAEHLLHDPLNRLAHLLVRPVIAVLFVFGITHGGIELAAVGPTTFVMLGSLWLGKLLGILAATIAAGLIFGLRLPSGLTLRDLILIASIMGIGFTVPALTLDPALPGGAVREAARAGLALSLLAGPLTLLLARLLRPTGSAPGMTQPPDRP
jgi:Na+:H+ antiporter, NhaA family